MAVHFQNSIYTHDNIYNLPDSNSAGYNRKIKIHYSLPKAGTNEDTGVLLLIGGFGANPNSNIYRKMRDVFPDKFNLVTVQAEHFGMEFVIDLYKKVNREVIEEIKRGLSPIFTKEQLTMMLPGDNFSVAGFKKLAELKSFSFDFPVVGDETIDNFCDMGFLQAIDNINALLNVFNLLYENNFKFNTKKVIYFGNSHGAYLAYLCNAFFPTLFSLIIDNSAWLYPKYLETIRGEAHAHKNSQANFWIEHFAYKNKEKLKILSDPQALSLPFLYKNLTNKAQILCYHATNDKLSPCEDKKEFLKNIGKTVFYEITQAKIDGQIFKSTKHGAGADFIKLFELAFNDKHVKFEKSTELDFIDKTSFTTAHSTYELNYKDIFPKLFIK